VWVFELIHAAVGDYLQDTCAHKDSDGIASCAHERYIMLLFCEVQGLLPVVYLSLTGQGG
jgi:hypothetical protein